MEVAEVTGGHWVIGELSGVPESHRIYDLDYPQRAVDRDWIINTYAR